MFRNTSNSLGLPTLMVSPESANESKSVNNIIERHNIYIRPFSHHKAKQNQTNKSQSTKTNRKGEWETAAIALQHTLAKPLGCKFTGSLAEEKLRLPTTFHLSVFRAPDISLRSSRSFFLTFFGLLFLQKPLKKQSIHNVGHRYSSGRQLAQSKFISKLEMQGCWRGKNELVGYWKSGNFYGISLPN